MEYFSISILVNNGEKECIRVNQSIKELIRVNQSTRKFNSQNQRNYGKFLKSAWRKTVIWILPNKGSREILAIKNSFKQGLNTSNLLDIHIDQGCKDFRLVIRLLWAIGTPNLFLQTQIICQSLILDMIYLPTQADGMYIPIGYVSSELVQYLLQTSIASVSSFNKEILIFLIQFQYCPSRDQNPGPLALESSSPPIKLLRLGWKVNLYRSIP